MLITLLITCSFFQGIQSHLSASGGHFTIVAPGTIRSNSEYQIALSLDEFTHSCWFNLTLETSVGGVHEVIGKATVEVEPKTTKLVKMQLPKLYHGYGHLTAIGYRGIIFKEMGRIIIEERPYTQCIQTDKAKYKPGELMQFRVIFIDWLTRPAEIEESIDVCIYDGQNNLVKKFSDAKLKKGVFKGDMQLSEHPVLGEWVIEVTVGGVVLEEQLFEVARYILPKFSVKIDTKKNVAVDEGKVLINVKSRYTYGQPVNGNLTIHLHRYETPGYSTVTVTDAFNGETTKSLDFETDLNLKTNIAQKSYPYTITTTVTEALTGQSYSATTMFRIHSQPYTIEVDALESIIVDDFVNIMVSVRDLQDNPIADSKHPIRITVTPAGFDISKLIAMTSNFENFQFGMPSTVEGSVYLNENGTGMVSLKLPSDEIFSEFETKANYLGYVSYPTILKRNSLRTLNLEVLTERPEIGKELLIQLSSTNPIVYFIYEIVSRGNIIQSDRINVPDNKTTCLLKINPTYSMVPKITLFVHHIKNGVLNTRLKDVYIKRAFQNSINITTEEEALPGALVSLNVTTDEDSYVGLLGIDERLVLDANYKTSLTEDNLYTELRNYDPIYINDEALPGSRAGLITFSNAINREGVVLGTPFVVSAGIGAFVPPARPFDKPIVGLPRIRKLFSDSWMFKDFERTPSEGLQLNEVIPDTITSWAITGFSLNPSTGLSLTKNATKLKVFKAFFISMDLPSLVKEGEIIEIPIYIFNYMNQNLSTEVTFQSPCKNLEILNSLRSESEVQYNQTYSKTISNNGKEKVLFFVRPQKSGRYNVTVKAISPLASDAIEKTLTVESDGVAFSISKTYMLHLAKDSQERVDELSMEIPENVVQNSESIHLSVLGDIFGPLMRTLQNLVRIPFGNSESNMRYLVSNLLVLKYQKTMNHSNESLERKAKLYLELGYQTQLTFRHLDGSFSLFDRTVERSGDTRLTAYTMWALQQAKNFIQIDSRVIERGLRYLKSKQTNNGGLSSGRDLDEDAALTALTLLAFLVEDESQNQFQDVITKGLAYLYETLDDLEHPTTAAISTYALVMGKHGKSEELLAKLSTQAALQSKQLQWTSPDNIESNLATTTYIFMSLLESQQTSLQTLFPILRSLISIEQSTAIPSHMLALEAMIKFAHHIVLGSTNLNIHFEDDHGDSGDFHVNASNAQVLQQVQLQGSSRRIKLQTIGEGLSLVDVSYKFNIIFENQSSSNYQTNVTVKELTDWTLVLDVCVAKIAPRCHNNLTIMEVNFPSGYTVYENSFQWIKETNEWVKSIESMESVQSVRVYLENIPQNGTCIRLGGTKVFTVLNLKPISVVVYDVERDHQLSVLYHKLDQQMMEN